MDIIILGAGSQAKYVIDNLSFYEDYNILGILDLENNSKIHGEKIEGVRILGNFEDEIIKISKSVRTIVAHSDNKKKQNTVKSLKNKGFNFINAIHPSAIISDSCKLGNGMIINSNVSIMPGAIIKGHSILHSNTVVEHDCVLEEYVNLAPSVSLSGFVIIKRRAYVFTGASIIPSIVIGEDAIIGAGAVVISNVKYSQKVVGNPAHAI